MDIISATKEALSPKEMWEYYIQVGTEALVFSILLRIWKMVSNGLKFEGWRRELLLWAVSFLGFGFTLIVAKLLLASAMPPITVQVAAPASRDSVPIGPDFTGYIESIGMVPPGLSNLGNDAAVVAIVRISNRGAPSIVWNWDMEITLLSGQRIEPKKFATNLPLLSATSSSFIIASGSTSLKMDSSTFLPFSLGQTPLETGGAREGWVAFDFGNAPVDELKRPGVIFDLKLEDSRGKTYPIELIAPAAQLYPNQ